MLATVLSSVHTPKALTSPESLGIGSLYIYTHMHTYTRTHARTHMHTHLHTHAHTHTHTHTHSHTYTELDAGRWGGLGWPDGSFFVHGRLDHQRGLLQCRFHLCAYLGGGVCGSSHKGFACTQTRTHTHARTHARKHTHTHVLTCAQ